MRNNYGNSQAALSTSTGEIMSLKSVRASGFLSGLLLDMTVRQTYRNETDQTLETVYTFPLAWGAVLLGLNVEIAGKHLSGVVLEKKEAERRYEDAITDGDSPVLLEQSGDGLFTANLGNLKPGEEAVIEFRYAQLLRYEQNRIRVSVPTTIAPRYGDAERQGGIRPHEAVEADLLAEYPFELSLTLAGDVAKGTVQSPTHTISTACQNDQLLVSLSRGACLDRDFVLTIEGLGGQSLSTFAQDGKDSVVMASFCPKIAGGLRDSIDLKILVDCSGSMGGDSIRSAKSALHQVLSELGPKDRMSYSRFGSSVAHTFKHLMQAGEATILNASRAISMTDADMGGTEMDAALLSVFALRGETKGADVLLITDGEVWESDEVIKSARESGHRIFAVGVGSAPAETLLRKLAEETGGACELVSPNEDIDAAIVRMFHRIRLPRAGHLQVDWTATPKWSTPLPSALFDGDTVHVFAAFDSPPQVPPVLSFEMAGDERIQITSTAPSLVENDALVRLAGNERLKQSSGISSVELALQYQLVTRHTSLFLVHLREEEDKANDLPHLQKIAHMQAAGWGGAGSVAEDGRAYGTSFPVPSIMFSRRRSKSMVTLGMDDSGCDTLDVPAFLLRQSDDPVPAAFERSYLLSLLVRLLQSVNKHLTHPDDLPDLITMLEDHDTEFLPLFSLVDQIKTQISNPEEAWVAFIVWAELQVDTEHQLTRHAARAIRGVYGSISSEGLVGIMVLIDARMEELSSDGWPRRCDLTRPETDEMGVQTA